MRLRLALGLSCVAILSGCVPQGAGYSLARDTVRDRTSWSVEPDGSSARVRAELLAKPLSADSAARVALTNEHRVGLALSAIGVSRAELASALRLPNPHAEVGVHFRGEEVEAEVQGTIDIVPLLLLGGRESVASMRLDAASLEGAASLLDVAFEAKVAFYDCQAASQVLELRKTVAYAAAQSAELARRLREAGNTPELAMLQEQALYEEARLSLSSAEVAEAVARQRLNAAMGLFGDEASSWKVSSRLADPSALDLDNLESRAIAANLDIAAQSKRHGAAAAEVDLAWARGFLPGVEVGAAAQLEEGAWEAGPHVGLELPLFYQGQGEVAAAEAQMNLAKNARAVTAVQVRATARASSEFYTSTLLPLREKIVAETLRKYNAMDLGPSQLLMAKRDQIETSRAYVESLRDYWVTRAQAEMLLAGRAPTVVAMPTSAPAPSRAGGGGHD